MAAFGRDTDANNVYDQWYFTDNVPEGAEKVNISGAATHAIFTGAVTIPGISTTLENGIATVSLTVNDLQISDILEKAPNVNAQAALMDDLLNPNYTVGSAFGVQPAWSATGTLTREMGNYNNGAIFDANLDQVLINPVHATIGLAFQDAAFQSDKSAHKPAPINFVTIVGLPINDQNGAESGNTVPSGEISSTDAYNLLVDPKAKPNTFIVSGNPATHSYGAIVGYDQFSNPAPFLTSGALATFAMNDVGGPVAAIESGGPFGVPPAGNVIGPATPYLAFVPFGFPAVTNSIYIDPAATVGPAAATYANVDTSAEGVTFDVQDKVNAVNFGGAGINPILDITAGKDEVSLQVVAEAGLGDSFTLRAKTRLGQTVQINVPDSTTGKTTLNIPRDGSTVNAEQDVVFFTRVREQDGPLYLILEGNTAPKTITNITVPIGNGAPPLEPGIRPADPGDFPPSKVTVLLNTIQAVVDTEHKEVLLYNAPGLPIPTVLIFDAFGNTYYPGIVGAVFDPVTLEDADATVAVIKSNGSPYPGASADIDGNNIIVGLSLPDVTEANGDPILKITAGTASAQITYRVRALVKTLLVNRFVPVFGVDDTPIVLNFADQNGAYIIPVTNGPGFDVDVEATDGTTSEGVDFTKILSEFNPREVFTAQLADGDADKIMTIDADGTDANAGKTTLTLNFNADFEKPVVGGVTVSDCAISIAITDNKAVNLAGSTVVVKNGSTGADVTATLTRTNTTDGTPAGSIDFTNVPVGSYTLDIVAKDQANNTASPVNLAATVTTCGAEAGCASVDPAFSLKGSTVDVVITGTNTNFGATSAVTFSCPGVTVNSATANSATEITASITIAAGAADAACDVTVTTGAETVVCSSGFEIKTETPGCASVSPASVDAGFTGDVTITLSSIDVSGLSDIAVSFGCPGVTVNSTTVTGPTTVVANITIAEDTAGGTCSVTVSRGSSLAIVCQDAFTVLSAPECSITLSPSTVSAGFIFPRFATITITGSNCTFDDTTTVNISGKGVRIFGRPTISDSTITVRLFVRPRLFGGPFSSAGEKTVTVTTGTETATATLTVE